LVYNLNWLTSIVFSSSTSSNLRFSFRFIFFIPLIISFLFCILLSLIFFLIWWHFYKKLSFLNCLIYVILWLLCTIIFRDLVSSLFSL
jgi:hypothetical protein